MVPDPMVKGEAMWKFLALTHFKGHTQGGFGGSNKNFLRRWRQKNGEDEKWREYSSTLMIRCTAVRTFC